MKELVILSGKGGTGKTTITGSFAVLAQNKVIADLDVDAADLHLLLKPVVQRDHLFKSGQIAVIDKSACNDCDLCQQLCRFDAIHDNRVDPIACEGCGFCAQVCPANAITMQTRLSGHWFVSDTKYGPLVHARLGVASENSGRLVTLIREQARQLALSQGLDLLISDGPPGIGCPVISSLGGSDLALLVTEPSPSGRHDLTRIVELCHHFKVPCAVCINKFDINEAESRQIETFCEGQEIPVLARIPYDNIVNQALRSGEPLVSHTRNGIAGRLTDLWQQLAGMLRN